MSRWQSPYAWLSKAPWWAAEQAQLLQSLDRKVSALMATEQELAEGVHQLFGVLDQIIAFMQTHAATGADGPAMQGLLDEVNAKRQSAADALSAVNPPAPPV